MMGISQVFEKVAVSLPWEGGDWLGLQEAILEWERVTGKDATAGGCPCCGQPHYFTEAKE